MILDVSLKTFELKEVLLLNMTNKKYHVKISTIHTGTVVE